MGGLVPGEDFDVLMLSVVKLDIGMEVFISEGRMSTCNVSADVELTIMGYTVSMKEKLETEFTDFGKTVVTVPDEVKALIAK